MDKEFETLLQDIEQKLPDMVTRECLSKATGHAISKKSLANLDSLDRGVSMRFTFRKKVCYPKYAVMEFLRKNLTVVKC